MGDGTADDDDGQVAANTYERLNDVAVAGGRALPGDEKFTHLMPRLEDPSPRVRANALRGLILLGVKQAEPLLHEMAHHQNARYRSSAAWVLGEVGDKIQGG